MMSVMKLIDIKKISETKFVVTVSKNIVTKHNVFISETDKTIYAFDGGVVNQKGYYLDWVETLSNWDLAGTEYVKVLGNDGVCQFTKAV